MRRADRQPGYSLVPSIQLSMLCSCSVLCLLLCCSLLLQYLDYQVLLLISTGTVLVYMYWYCRSIAQVHACERPTGYIKYESLVRMTLNPTHESIPLDSMCAINIIKWSNQVSNSDRLCQYIVALYSIARLYSDRNDPQSQYVALARHCQHSSRMNWYHD